MRWFVEVSRVGDTSVDEKYCVEAKQWQAALQEARRLRGDSGPLSKFSIELLDDGYRAVDPKQKLRFVVAKAPVGAELTSEGPLPHRNGQAGGAALTPSVAPPLVTPSVAPPPTASVVPSAISRPSAAGPVLAPTASVLPPVTAGPAPSRAPSASVLPPAAATASLAASAAPSPSIAAKAAAVNASAASAPLTPSHAAPYAGVPSSHLSPHALGGAPYPSSPALAGAAPSAVAPRPVTSAPRAASVKAPAGVAIPSDVIPPAPALPQNLGPAVGNQNVTQPSPTIDLPPPSSVLRKRQEEPTTESPITYREVAFLVAPGVTRGSVEALLWAAFRDISRELAGRPEQKFVQLAVFDHQFDKRPERPPLGTLAWKDWRGNPVITFPWFDGTQPARASVPAPSIKPLPLVRISSSAPPAVDPPKPPPSATVAPAPAAASITARPPMVVPVAAVTAPSASAAPPPVIIAPSSTPAEPAGASAPVIVAKAAVADPPSAKAVAAPSVPPAAADPPVVASVTPGVPVVASEPSAAIPLTREKLPSSHPSAGRSSRPRMAAVRRRAGEDLIGELFETMHDLHFMQGVAEGAEFLLAALDSVVPCDGVLIHVFDINRREFVVTRAKGPGAIQVLLHRTSDSEPFLASVMRRSGAVAIADVAEEPRLLGSRWETLGVKPLRALCGPVRQGGRYLGLVEAVNPLGDAPFHQTEQNALDYICEQFAQFLVNRPIVLEADVILRR